LEFQERFATEEACREFLFASRWPEGFVCPGCGSGRAGGQTRRHLWVCTRCGHQSSVTAGTVMHATRTPLRTWFWAAYLVATHHPGISAKQLQRQLGLKRYETAWLILQKLRRAMVAPEREALKAEVEIDEFFLGGHEEGLRGGRQRGKKALVGVAIEVRGPGSGRLRLHVLTDAPQPPPHADGRLPDPAWAGRRPPAHHLRADHPPHRRLTLIWSQPDTHQPPRPSRVKAPACGRRPGPTRPVPCRRSWPSPSRSSRTRARPSAARSTR